TPTPSRCTRSTAPAASPLRSAHDAPAVGGGPPPARPRAGHAPLGVRTGRGRPPAPLVGGRAGRRARGQRPHRGVAVGPLGAVGGRRRRPVVPAAGGTRRAGPADRPDVAQGGRPRELRVRRGAVAPVR